MRAFLILLLLVTEVSSHEQYGSWRRQDGQLCCGDRDCYPTEARFQNGSWLALRREDQKWLKVPQHLVLAGSANDGQAHLCALPPPPDGGEDTIYCFMMEAMGG
jgi:hypothetical protein